MIEPRQREPAQILDDEERVSIDSVGVEKIVLHAPYDSAEGRDVEPQHPIGIHSLQCPSDALRFSDDVKKESVVAGVLPELLVDEVEVLFYEGDCSCVDATQFKIPFQE